MRLSETGVSITRPISEGAHQKSSRPSRVSLHCMLVREGRNFHVTAFGSSLSCAWEHLALPWVKVATDSLQLRVATVIQHVTATRDRNASM